MAVAEKKNCLRIWVRLDADNTKKFLKSRDENFRNNMQEINYALEKHYKKAKA